MAITIDQEKAEKVFEEMKAERDKNYPNLSGMARLLSDLKLREAVFRGAQAYERKRPDQINLIILSDLPYLFTFLL